MKTKNSRPIHAKAGQPSAPVEPSEASIRECAYALYEKGNRSDGHDIADWVEATAVLKTQAGETQTKSCR